MFQLRRAAAAGVVLAASLLVSACTSASQGSPAVSSTTATGVSAPPSTTTVVSSTVIVVTSTATGSSPAPTSSAAVSPSRAVPTTSTAPPTTSATGPAASPVPACYPSSCPAVASTDLVNGDRLIAVNPSADQTVAVLLVGGQPFDQLPLRYLGPRPQLTCAAPLGAISCLVAGTPGAHTAFGRVLGVGGGRLSLLSPALADEGEIVLTQITADTLLVTSMHAFADFGAATAGTPLAWHTWTLVGRTFTETGCGVPTFTIGTTPVTTPQKGPCTGTPAISGYPAGKGPIADLSAGIVSTSGNLHCVSKSVDRAAVFCTIGQADFAVPACTVGQPGIIVSWTKGDKPTLSDCAGDIMVTAGRNPVAYGQLAYGNGFGCVIAASGGVRCTDGSGHGFVLARSGYSTF